MINLNTVKEIKELTNTSDVNKLLADGWKLLTITNNKKYIKYILGRIEYETRRTRR